MSSNILKMNFSKDLLSKTIKYWDDSSDLDRVYKNIKKYLEKKCQKDPRRKEKFDVLEKQYLEIYERIKAKEEKLKEEKGVNFQRSFYSIALSNRAFSKVFRRLRFKRRLYNKIPT